MGNLTKDARQRYEDLFEEQDQDRDGYIDGEDVRTIWLRSGLDAPALGKVWNLADRDCDGYLTRVEFVVGMFLIDDRLRGYPIPEQLPYFLQQLQ